MKQKPSYEDVTYEMAVPAKKIEIIKWLISGGRYGKLFVNRRVDFRRWSAMDDINCRCVVNPKLN